MTPLHVLAIVELVSQIIKLQREKKETVHFRFELFSNRDNFLDELNPSNNDNAKDVESVKVKEEFIDIN